eukprot:4917213-Pyramimonas_sp.AAC.1
MAASSWAERQAGVTHVSHSRLSSVTQVSHSRLSSVTHVSHGKRYTPEGRCAAPAASKPAAPTYGGSA